MTGTDAHNAQDVAFAQGMIPHHRQALDRARMTAGRSASAELEGASGAAFDRMFLTMVIAHHEGAVEMAEAELAQGRHGPARAMAEDVVSAQIAEIAEMRKPLGEG
ncbi:DUF305 domain-containing protein [Streptomyces tagetis]|uniref:DUF305 domain-containing protein n=1 Tax=Streptomyces tagetis TaxID=2820809 RepID=UPI0027DBE6A4|nr:DUF305 domain-containing protein [Streptomyces sp. RG38]